MKKILICALCAIILLGLTSTVTAKENYVKRTSSATVRGGRFCDFNNDRRSAIDDITRYIDYCYLTNKGGIKCDTNKDGKVNISDIVYFNDVCYKEVLNQPKGNTQVRKLKTNKISTNRRR